MHPGFYILNFSNFTVIIRVKSKPYSLSCLFLNPS